MSHAYIRDPSALTACHLVFEKKNGMSRYRCLPSLFRYSGGDPRVQAENNLNWVDRRDWVVYITPLLAYSRWNLPRGLHTPIVPSKMSESSQASKYQIPKIEWDDERDEPFCRITIKGEENRMTMWRESDGDDMVCLLCLFDMEGGWSRRSEIGIIL